MLELRMAGQHARLLEAARKSDQARRDERAAEHELDLRVLVQRDRARVAAEALAVDVGDHPARERTEVAAVEALVPDIEELPELERDLRRRLDVDDAVGRVRVKEREAAAAGDEHALPAPRVATRSANPDAERNRALLSMRKQRE